MSDLPKTRALARYELEEGKPLETTVTGTLRLALTLTVLALASDDNLAQVTEATGIFSGHGIVKAIQPGTGVLTLDHDDIKGCMPAMEMMYKVGSPDLSRYLRPGDEVNFRIDAGKYVIVEVERVAQAKWPE